MGKLEKIMNLLREEYRVPKRRSRGSPVDSLIQVILSQNTNDTNSARAYRSLMDRFEGPEEILEADVGDVAEAISVSGLYNLKAKRIKESLEKIVEERGELSLDFLGKMDLEEARSWLTELPGVGPKSAAIILNFSFDKPAFPVDTHVFRVSRRLGLIPEKATREKAHQIMESKVPAERTREFHINLIRHGRGICKARRPMCEECVLRELCEYYNNLK